MVSATFLLYVVRESEALYEIDLSGPGKREDSPHLAQFIVLAALDELQLRLKKNTGGAVAGPGEVGFLKTIDQFNDFAVSAYTTAAGLHFLLLHKLTNNSNNSLLKSSTTSSAPPSPYGPFFQEVHEVFASTVLVNPFYHPFQHVQGGLKTLLDVRLQAVGKKHLI
ncbi:unnamed protein product [Amoebophrya sp. A25]|nr:unnamed protein product [Amoebophrya sp. A25]|eukprot:GSA25T00023930001.1